MIEKEVVVYKNLGWINSWTKTPVEFSNCVALGHVRKEVKRGNCWYRMYCETCGIMYDVDSSD